ncbi:hypothetical protein YC2023_123016 [Brassica napus]
MDASNTSDAYIRITNDVINKSRNDLVFTGELDESVLTELHSIWRRKMIQAGVIRGTIETSSPPIQNPNPLHGYAQNKSGIDSDPQFPSTELSMSIKNEGEGLYIPQQDGASDDIKPSAFAPHGKVKKRKNKWECKLKAGVMQINEKNILFSEVGPTS